MKSCGKLYVDTLTYPPKFRFYPLAELGRTIETDEPYRAGRCLVVKLPFMRQAFLAGLWGKPQEETTALTKAIQGRPLGVDPSEIMEW